MIKTGTKNIKRIAFFALAMVLSMSLVLPAFADPAPGEPGYRVSTGSEGSDAKAALTKIFLMPENTDTPDIKFVFDFKPESFNGEKNAENMAKMPANIAPVEVVFKKADLGDTDSETGVKTLIDQQEIFKGVKWEHEGIYKYLVSERNDTYKHGTIDEFEEKLIYSGAVYEIDVYVVQGVNELYVLAIAAYIVVHDESNEDQPIGSKVDPTPGTEIEIDGDYSRMIFTNKYIKNNGTPDITDPEDPDDIDKFSVLKISKKVDDNGDKDKAFNFSATVNIPAEAAGGKELGVVDYVAYKIGKNASSNTAVLQVLKFKPGIAQDFTLKHGEYLAFTDMHVGASFNVNELATPNYKPSYEVFINDKSAGSANAPSNNSLSTGLKRLGEARNSADYLNTVGLTIPTGISVDNLPYIVLIIASALALAGYIVIKSRLNGKAKS